MLDYSKLPEGLRGGMQRYFEHGIEPGGFLMAVLENDLQMAIERADMTNSGLLFEIVCWVHNEAPEEACGSPEKCRAHMQAMRKRREATA